MNKDSKSKKGFLILILVLTISIGYAAIASTLKINGNTTVKGLNWSIYWDNVVPTTGSVTGANVVTAPTTSGTTTTTIDFSVILPEPGDFYEFEVDAVNAGTIDAMIADNGVITKAYSDANYTNEVTLPDVVRYTVTYQDGTAVEPNHLLAKMSGNTPTRERYKVRVEYRNDDEIDPDDLDGDNDRQYYLRFEVEYVQADSSAIDLHPAPVVNPYLTTFDGNYTYEGPESYPFSTSFSNDWTVYLRNDGTASETCAVFGNGTAGTVCMTSSYYNSNYSSVGNYNSDFEDCSEGGTGDFTSSDINNSCLKGYNKAKAVEMLNKGASSCNVSSESVNCYMTSGGVCTIGSDGHADCYDDNSYGACLASDGGDYCSY